MNKGVQIMNTNKKVRCSICGKTFYGYGNNAQPINNGRCCDDCNSYYVIPERMIRYLHHEDAYDTSKPINVFSYDNL